MKSHCFFACYFRIGFIVFFLLCYLLSFYLSIETSHCMDGQGYSNSHHGLLVLSNSRNTNSISGFSLHLSFSNHVSTSQMQNFSSAGGVQPISPRTLVLKNPLFKAVYENNINSLKTNLCNTARELQSLVQNSKQDFAASLYLYLKHSINAHNNRISKPTIDFMNECLIKIEPLLFDESGFLKTLKASELKNISLIINECRASAIHRLDCEGARWCAYDALGDSQNLERLQVQGLTALNKGIDILFGANNPELLSRFQTALSDRDYAYAYNIMERVDSKTHVFFESVYAKCFEENYNIKGIDRRFLDDPFAQDLMERLPDSKVPSVHNSQLQRRFYENSRFLDECGIENPTADVKLFAYRFGDRNIPLMQKLENICNFVCSSNSNTYHQLCFINGLPRLAKYNDDVAAAQFPEAFNTQAHVKDKILITRLGLLDTTDLATKKYVNQVITYIQQGCTEHVLAQEYRKLGHLIGNAILNYESSWCLKLTNMVQEAPSEHLGTLKQKVMRYIVEHASEDNSFCSKLGLLYERALQGDEVAQSFLEQALMPEISEQILMLDIDSMHTEISKFSLNNSQAITINQFNKLADAHRNIQKNGVVYSEKTYAVDLQTRMLMVSKGDKLEPNLRYRGNQLEHAIHDNILENYERSASIKREGLQPAVKSLVGCADKSNALADQSLQIRNYENAINLATFASYAYEYIENLGKHFMYAGTQIVEGSVEGVVEGVKSVAHQIAHPIETVQKMARGAANLLILAHRLNKHQPSILPFLKDPIGSREYYNSYYREIGVDPELIEKFLSELTIKDVAKGTAQFLTEGILAGEIFKFSGAVCRTLKNQGILIARDAEIVNTWDKIAIAAGEIEVKFAQEVETVLLENHQAGLQAHITDAVSLECPPSCVNQYEKLKEALRIEEFTSIIDCSEHGLQRLLERDFTPTEVHDLFKTPDIFKAQADGGHVFIKQIENNRFNLLIYNPEKEIVITALKNIKENDLISLSKNYGWNL